VSYALGLFCYLVLSRLHRQIKLAPSSTLSLKNFQEVVVVLADGPLSLNTILPSEWSPKTAAVRPLQTLLLILDSPRLPFPPPDQQLILRSTKSEDSPEEHAPRQDPLALLLFPLFGMLLQPVSTPRFASPLGLGCQASRHRSAYKRIYLNLSSYALTDLLDFVSFTILIPSPLPPFPQAPKSRPD